MPQPVGTWRSLVAYLNGVQGVPGSNPGVPTKITEEKRGPVPIPVPITESAEPSQTPRGEDSRVVGNSCQWREVQSQRAPMTGESARVSFPLSHRAEVSQSRHAVFHPL